MIRIGSALFNANHGQLAAELDRLLAAGIDFLHFDVFDGHFVPDLAFPPRTMETLRARTNLPFEVHLAANDPLRFLPALKRAGADLVFLPAESTPLLYEAIFTVREAGLKAGLCLALGTSLSVLEPVLPLLDSVLLLGRVTGEGQRGRSFNPLLIERVAAVRQQIDGRGLAVDLQAAGGLELEDCRKVVAAGAHSLPLGAALHREPDLGAYLGYLRGVIGDPSTSSGYAEPAEASLVTRHSSLVTKILIASRSFGPHCPAALERLRAAGCELIANPWGRTPSEAELLERIADSDVLVSGTEPVTAAVLAAAPKLKLIAKHGVGYENIDLAAARARSIPVALAGGAIIDSVADMAFGLLLALARQIPQGDRAVRGGAWPRMVGVELRGKTLGIVGLGQIGKAVCKRAVGFGMQVIAYDRYPDERFARSWGVGWRELDTLLAEADFVTLHAPASAETRHLIDAAALARMRPGSYLINTARGDLVDEHALLAALRSGHLAGAACDVFEREPPGASELLTLEQFIAAPHSAGQTHDGLRRMGEITAENILRVLAGEQPLYQPN
jgi:ribulose-phosphate 3-epimerase